MLIKGAGGRLWTTGDITPSASKQEVYIGRQRVNAAAAVSAAAAASYRERRGHTLRSDTREHELGWVKKQLLGVKIFLLTSSRFTDDP